MKTIRLSDYDHRIICRDCGSLDTTRHIPVCRKCGSSQANLVVCALHYTPPWGLAWLRRDGTPAIRPSRG